MYLQDLRQVTSTHDKVTTHTQHVRTYKTQDRSPIHMTIKVTTHTVRTYKTPDRLPLQVTKLQHTQHVPTRPETNHQNM